MAEQRREQRRTQQAHGQMRTALALRATLAAAGAVVLVVSAILLARAGIVDHLFPPFVADDGATVITAYSGPHLIGAIGLGTAGGLLLVSALTDLWRRALLGRSLAQCRPSLGH